MNKHLSTKHYTENSRVSNMNLTRNRGELSCSGRISIFFSISGTRRAVFVTNPVISNTRRYQKHFRNLVGMIFINRGIQENQKKTTYHAYATDTFYDTS
jgi:hypothetical protein